LGYLLIGPITKDKNIIRGEEILKIGGAVYYQSKVLSKLGIEHTTIVTLSKKDEKLLEKFPQRTQIIPIWKNATLNFENKYLNPEKRIQKSNFAKNPIKIKDIKSLINSNWDGILLNPLLPTDIPIQTLKFIANQQKRIYINLQGYLRVKSDDKVSLKPPENIKKILKLTDKVFIDENEARIFNQNLVKAGMLLESMGPSEVIITCGEKGSLIYSKRRVWRIKAVPAQRIIDPTGLGDTYMAAYIYMRKNTNPMVAGKFASKIATKKLENKL